MSSWDNGIVCVISRVICFSLAISGVSCWQRLFGGLRWFAGCLGLAWRWLWVHGGEGLISGFQGFSASISKICAFIPFHLKMGVLLILAGGLALGYHSIGFRHFPHIS